jgi:hypothetical protein
MHAISLRHRGAKFLVVSSEYIVFIFSRRVCVRRLEEFRKSGLQCVRTYRLARAIEADDDDDGKLALLVR